MRTDDLQRCEATEAGQRQPLDIVQAHLSTRAVQRRVMIVCACAALFGIGILTARLVAGQGFALKASSAADTWIGGHQI